MKIKSTFKQVNSITLHVKEAGEQNDKLLVLLHGFPEYWYSWKKYISFFSKKGYHVIVPDQRGYNLSDKPKKVKDYAIKLLVQDIALLIKSYDKKEVYIVGHDWGAIVTWGLAIYYPKIIKKIVICNVPHPDVFMNYIIAHKSQLKRSWYILFFQLPKIPEFFAKLRNYRFLKIAIKGKHKKTRNEIKGYQLAWSQPGCVSGMINWYRALLKYRPKIPKKLIDLPVLILWGEKDLALEAAMAKLSLKKCNNGKLIYFPDTSHWVQHERIPELKKIISEFIEDDL